MTQETPVDVTQEDRDAASAYLSLLVPTMPNLAEKVAVNQTALARAFAKHRTASTSPTQADAVSVEAAYREGHTAGRIGASYFFDEDSDWHESKALADLTAMNTSRERCPYCDGTGDVHRTDGEWLGECDCEKLPKPASRDAEVERLALKHIVDADPSPKSDQSLAHEFSLVARQALVEGEPHMDFPQTSGLTRKQG